MHVMQVLLQGKRNPTTYVQEVHVMQALLHGNRKPSPSPNIKVMRF